MRPIPCCVAVVVALSGCAKPECEFTQTRCNGLKVETCTALGKWREEADCALLALSCSTATGDAKCTNLAGQGGGSGGGSGGGAGGGSGGGVAGCAGQLRCTGQLLEECSGTQTWSTRTDCGAAGQSCVSGACVATPCNRGVDPEFRCVGQLSQICANGYDTYADCPARGSSCDPTTGRCHTTAACTAGQERCTGDDKERCIGGGWALQQRCAYTAQTCVFQFEANCTGTPQCINGERRCAGTNVETCSNGVFAVTTNCATQAQACQLNVPDAGVACVSVACQEGTVTCAVDVASICENGTLFTDDCGARGQFCDPVGSGGCRATCRADTSRCRGNNLDFCNAGVYQAQVCPNGCQASSPTTADCL